jgi:hypothetical protein
MPLATNVPTPLILNDPGILWMAPLGTAAPTNTVAASVFTDVPAAAYVLLGATEEGSAFSYSSTVEAIRVAEFFDPIKYATTERQGNMAFNLADVTLQNLKRALNGGTGAITPTSGTGATTLSQYEAPTPGNEVRTVLLWESRDATMRIYMRQVIQGGELTMAFRKAPAIAVIPCQFSFEKPTAAEPFTVYAAGVGRLGT